MAEITKREGNYITIEHTFDLRGDMLETEENIMMANNEIGRTYALTAHKIHEATFAISKQELFYSLQVPLYPY